jgi:biotin carboxyl carrier protein
MLNKESLCSRLINHKEIAWNFDYPLQNHITTLQVQIIKFQVDVSKVILSPMPGVVRSVSCKVGDSIAEGQEVCVVGMYSVV